MSIDIHHDHLEAPRHDELLALRQVRRGLERVAAQERTSAGPFMAITPAELQRRRLTELIEALDRRAPSAERAGEAAIARDAATLRRRGREQLAELDAAKRLERF